MVQQRRAVRIGVALGAGITDPRAAVDLAILAEELGYDQIAVDGADGQAWDAWTLLSWIAGRTERVGLVPLGVDASPTRPTVLARAAASLDLLSAGRVTLGLGPTSSLADAVTVVRRMWDTSGGKVHHDGPHRVAGADPGPTPAHNLPVWLSGADRATIEVAGQVADGWVGVLDADDPVQLSRRLRLLGEAARRAGRDPRELERVVIVPGPDTDLAALVIDHGVTAVLLQVDDPSRPELLEQFIGEVEPRLREAARQARSDGTTMARPLRRADVRARRRPGIDYDGLPDSLAETAVEPGDLTYGAVRSTYLRGGAPGLVLRPRSVAEVTDAVTYARRHPHLPLGVRSGGHGLSGRSTNDGGLVVDVGALNRVEVLDETHRLVRIGPGARWRQVATALQPRGWALGSGDYGGVGVGGLATAGGIGFLGRKHGLTIDHLRAVEMVLADGSVVRASAGENPELFWAVRGAGANFGIATSFEFVVDEVPDVGWAQLAFQVADPAGFLVEFGRVASSAPRETTAFLVMGGGGTAQMMAMVASDDPDVVIAQLQPFAELAPMVQQHVVIAPYAAVMNMFPDTPHLGRGEPISRSGLVTRITPEVGAESARLLAGGAVHWFQLRTMGGAIADVAPGSTAFAHRDAQFQITAMGGNAQRVDRWWAAMRPHLDGLYLSFETDTDAARIGEAFPPATLARLQALKTELDPTNLFQDNFNLFPQSRPAGRPA